MISFIHGTLSEMGENHIVVEAGGVGYGIFVPATVLPQLPTVGEEVKIYTHFSVREDGQNVGKRVAYAKYRFHKDAKLI